MFGQKFKIYLMRMTIAYIVWSPIFCFFWACYNSIIFIITDLKNEIIVTYEGIVPNLFSEGKGVVAEGKLRDKKYFVADKILAKHDENYMPPEVSEILEKSN